MKRFIKALFSIFVAMTISSPMESIANPVLELNEVTEEEEVSSTESDPEGYTIMFLRSDFGLSPDRRDISDQAGSLVMFMTNPKSKIIKNAQVVVTLISPTGEQTMLRARPHKGGYFIPTDSLDLGRYRLEAEIIADGWLLTDQVCFEHV